MYGSLISAIITSIIFGIAMNGVMWGFAMLTFLATIKGIIAEGSK